MKDKESKQNIEDLGVEEKVNKHLQNIKPYVVGIGLGVAGMLVYRKYESYRIGKGFSRVVHNPELLALFQKNTEHLKES